MQSTFAEAGDRHRTRQADFQKRDARQRSIHGRLVSRRGPAAGAYSVQRTLRDFRYHLTLPIGDYKSKEERTLREDFARLGAYVPGVRKDDGASHASFRTSGRPAVLRLY